MLMVCYQYFSRPFEVRKWQTRRKTKRGLAPETISVNKTPERLLKRKHLFATSKPFTIRADFLHKCCHHCRVRLHRRSQLLDADINKTN
jgi:hypothetical protein